MTRNVDTRNEGTTAIELDFDERTMRLLELTAERTGFPVEKVVEYAIADRIITETMRDPG